MTARPNPGPSLLLVEDDDATRAAVVRDLVARGYHVDDAPDGSTALARWDARRPDVVLLDLGLPDLDGLTLIRRIRREATTPILVLSARGAEETKVEALELGADDYITKPFGIAELHARLQAALRRAGGPAADPAGRLVTRGRLLRAVWGEAYAGEDHYVHVFVSQVRRKLAAADPDGALRDLIVTEPGVGYRVRAG